jgi:phospholipase C
MSTPTIENIIVVMLENRSYDNMLGGLYLNSNPAPYNTPPANQAGLNGLRDTNGNPKNLSNPYPSSSSKPPIPIGNQTAPTQIGGAGTYYPVTAIPVVDPGEPFGDMAWQITGSQQSSNPYVSWPPSSTANLMQGFTGDYASQSGVCVTPPPENYPDVMNYFTPAQVPVTAWLANNFGVCDQWFASAPTHTFANRAFAHCGTPGLYWDSPGASDNQSFIDDPQYIETQWNIPSIFYMLDAAYPSSASTTPPNWKVYFHDYCISMLTVPYVMDAAITNGNANGNVATYDNTDWGTETPRPVTLILPREQTPLKNVVSTFMEDLNNGTLPKYSFIEPRYSNGRVYSSNPSEDESITPNSYPANCNHPGAANYPGFAVPPNPVCATNPPIDVADGEAFLKQLYNALNQSQYWNKTLLIITYDEHGGCYDHVPPPAFTPLSPASSTLLGSTIETTVPPGSKNPTSTTPSIDIPPASNILDKTSDGFEYNVYGCRVPTIVVSPYVEAGTQISPPQTSKNPFDHASIISTIWDIFFTNGNPTNPPTVSSLTNRDGAAPSLYDALDFSINNNPGVL